MRIRQEAEAGMFCWCARALAATLAVFAWPVESPAQVDRGEVRLQVTDLAGIPIRASGTLTSEAPQLARTFLTDSRGFFALQDLPFGVYRLTVERETFATHSEVVEVRSAVPKTLRIELALGTFDTRVEVTVAQPLVDPGRTGLTFSIAAPQIQDRLPAVPGRRLLDLIDAQPGWLVEANGVLHPRGSEYQTLFVVDGFPMDENRSPAFAPDLQDDDVQAVNVLTGNFPAEYGRKLGGVVEVTTGRDMQEGFHGVVDGGGGSFGTATGSFSGSYGWGSRALTFRGSAARTSRYLDPPVIENFENRGALGGASLSYEERPSDADRVFLTWHRRATAFHVPNEHLQQAEGQRQRRTGSDDLAQASWTRVLGARSVFSARGAVQRLTATLESNEHSTPIVVAQDRSFTRAYSNFSLAADLGRHQVKVGGDVLWAPVREELSYEITNPSVFDADTPQFFRFSDSGRDREQSLFGQDTMTLGAFTISLGLRWDRYALVEEAASLSPRLGFAWSPGGRDLVLRASYDSVFQTPAIENLLLASSPVVELSNPGSVRLPVLPSRGHFAEGGFTVGLAGRARLDVSAYRRTLVHFADDDVFLNTGISFPVAFDSAVIGGVDAKLTWPRWGRLGGFASYSLLQGTARLPVVGGLFLSDEAIEALEEVGEVSITQDQRHTFRGQLRCEVSSRAWAAVSVRFGSGLPVEVERDEIDAGELSGRFGDRILQRVDLERGRVRPNLAFDAGVGATLLRQGRRRLTARLEIANLANRFDVINFAGLFSGTALAAPRSAAMRLRYEF
jgi:hypothetical protein